MSTLVIGVGGPTSSGKTTLSKHLYKLLASSQSGNGSVSSIGNGNGMAWGLVHQDDYALAEEQLPWHEEGKFRDWDAPVGSIDYARMTRDIRHFRNTGQLAENHTAHDHLNVLPDLPISKGLADHWRERFAKLLYPRSGAGASSEDADGQVPTTGSSGQGSQLSRILIADGFLLYYDAQLRSQLDLRFFMRVTRDTIKRRRGDRGGYNTAEGQLWQDPPNYFDLSLWPNYVEAHRRLFQGGDVEKGLPVQVSSPSTRTSNGSAAALGRQVGKDEEGGAATQGEEDRDGDGAPVEGLVVLSGEDDSSMELLVQKACEVIEEALIRRLSSAPSSAEGSEESRQDQ